MSIEPLGSIMSIQAQTYQPKEMENKVESNINSTISLNQVEMVEKKASTIINVNESELRKDNKEKNDNKEKLNKKNNNLKEISEEEKRKLKEYIKNVNKTLTHTTAQFRMHEETNRVMIKIIDKETDKVIKEIPPEKILDSYANRMEMVGLFMDEKK